MASNYQITVTLEGRDNLSDELRQVNQQLGQIVTNTANTSNSVNRMENSVSSLRTGLGNANSMLQQFGLGISAMGIANAITDLNDLGREVTAVEATFDQLSGGPDAARRSLENMREITGGVVDDMTLMRGANSLLLTGLASTNDQAAELVNLGYRLSAAMGVDATEGIQNLNAALLNNSFARLDTLGISAAAVRQRVAELKAEGYDMSEAFSQAVLEEGRDKLEKLGEAAATGETAFNRVATSFKNAKADLAEFTAEGIEAGAQLIEIFGLIQEHGLQDVMIAAQGGNVEAVHRGDQIQARADEIMLQSMGVDNAAEMTPETRQWLAATAMASPENQILAMQALAQATREWTIAQIDANQQQDAAISSMNLFNETAQGLVDLEEQRAAAARAAERANSTEQLMLEGLGVAYENLTRSAENFQEVGGIEIMSPEDAQAVMNSADLMQTWFDDLEQMAQDSEFAWISEEELANAESMVDQANDLADQAERAAAAFEKMSLAQMMGTTGGGRLGELTDMVTGAIGDETVAAQVELELDLRSGRTTELEQAFENEFAATIAQIAEQVGPEAAADAAQRALAALEQGQLLGLTDEQIIASVQGAIGSEGQLGFFGAQSQAAGNIVGMAPVSMEGDMPAAPMGPEGTTPQENLTAMQDQLMALEEQSIVVKESLMNLSTTDLSTTMDPFVHSFETAEQGMNAIKARLDEVTARSYRTTLAIDVVVNDPTGAGGAWFAQQMATATVNNGGVPPGASPAAGSGPF